MSEISRRVDSMMATKMNELPEPAVSYMKYLSSKYGYCGEIAVTAFYHYLQAEVGLECHDDLYEIDTAGRDWFVKHAKEMSKAK